MHADDARAWLARWQVVNAAEVEELRAQPVEEKMRQLVALAKSAHLFDWSEADREDEAVRELWVRLREGYGVWPVSRA